MSTHFDAFYLVVRSENQGNLIEQVVGVGLDDRFVGLEVDLVQDLDRVLLEDRFRLLRRTTLIGDEPRFIRTFVLWIDDPVVVVVEIGAAIGVFEPIGIFRFLWTLVFCIWDAVLVRIETGVGTSVFVFVSVFVFRFVTTLIVVVGDSVAVVVRIGTSIFVFEPVDIFRFVWASVVAVDDSVTVVVVVWATVFIFKTVEIFRYFGAVVDVVGDSVTVEVIVTRSPTEAHERAEFRRSDSGDETTAAARHHGEPARRDEFCSDQTF